MISCIFFLYLFVLGLLQVRELFSYAHAVFLILGSKTLKKKSCYLDFNVPPVCLSSKMKSPIFPQDEDGGCNEPDYDFAADFSQFLEEARMYADDAAFSQQFLEEARMYADDAAFSQSHFSSSEWKEERECRKNKKSWRRAVSSFWFKFQKRKKKKGTEKEEVKLEPNCGSSKTTGNQRAVSGPLFGNGGKLAALHQKILTTSGPLSGCFTPKRAEELEVPYMYLNQHIHPEGVKAFGPIYLVT